MKKIFCILFSILSILILNLGVLSCVQGENVTTTSSSTSTTSTTTTTTTIVYNTITTNGRFATINNFYSETLKNNRTIRIYLPESYSTKTDTSFDVLYMDDGQNVFKPGGTYGCWNMEDVYDNLRKDSLVPDLILVGINFVNRTDEYNPYSTGDGGGQASNYLKMLTDELIPFLKNNFRIKTDPKNSTFMGSSYGGMNTLYNIWSRPDVFGKGVCMSGAYFCGNSQFLKEMLSYSGTKKDLKFWIDCGNGAYEGDDVSSDMFDIDGYIKHNGGDGMRMLFEQNLGMPSVLTKLGYQYETDFQYFLSYSDAHSESSWNKRAYFALRYIYATTNPTPTEMKVSVFPESVSITQTYPSAVIISEVTYDNGLKVTVPIENVTLTSDNDSIFSLYYGRIRIDKKKVTDDTVVNFTVKYKTFSGSCALKITKK
ncbi:MAG TPA: alpha/beta hydrolase-fold protein [Spirochaetota bacterium]|nr:alpha/beta hydrolase-fold protein [Spirochaetota bacterium]